VPDDLPLIPYYPGLTSGLQQFAANRPPVPPRSIAQMPMNLPPEFFSGIAQFLAGGAAPVGTDGGQVLVWQAPRKARPEPVSGADVPTEGLPDDLSQQLAPFFPSPDFLHALSQGFVSHAQPPPTNATPVPPTQSDWLSTIAQGLIGLLR
jgi:hypothetical protein